MAAPMRPRPEKVEDAARPYYEVTRRGELLLQRCASCQSYFAYVRDYGTRCLEPGSLEWVAAAGTGVHCTRGAPVAVYGHRGATTGRPAGGGPTRG